MIKIISLTGAALICGLALIAQRPPFGPEGHAGPWMGLMQPGSPVTGAPYSGTESIQLEQTFSDGNKIEKNEQFKIYRDSQGRVRIEGAHTSPKGTSATVVTIFDPVAGFMARLNPDKLIAMKHTLPASGSVPPRPHHPDGANATPVQKEDLGAKTINGLAVTGTRTTITIPAGQAGNSQPIVGVYETWISTALKVPVLETSTNPERGNSTRQLTVTSQSEPDPALFQIPSDYSVQTQNGPGGRHGGHPSGEQN